MSSIGFILFLWVIYRKYNVRYGLLKLDTKKRQTTFSVPVFKKV